MKKLFAYSSLFLFGLALLFSACQKENLSEAEFSPAIESDLPTSALIDPFGDREPVPIPDLVVSFTTNVTATTNNCGMLLPDVSCAANPPAGPPDNPHSFFGIATIQNIGTGDIPPGTVQLAWSLVGTSISNFTQDVLHNGIPAGGQITAISRPSFYLGPCDCVPPANYSTINLWALVDPNDLINEQSENNNQSTPFTACNGC